uniref:excinuclease ABC subunit UvrA n=1 Tax=Succinivibrio sp. TaxID=2053619 RepID=UPI00402A8F43
MIEDNHLDKGQPENIVIKGARVHNLKNIDIDVPLHQIVGIAGVSGSGKSSLALGVIYAEGSRRYLDSLSTYTRRRMTSAAKADVDEVLYVPAALALHQRPGVPGIRSTFGTGTELLNSLRLMFSRLASHRCENCGHYLEPTLNVAAEKEIICPHCHKAVYPPSAEELAFNSQGACPECSGTGFVRTVDESTLVPDESKTIDEGAVLPWQTLMWSLMKDIARDLGVRTDVPFKELTQKERDIVFNGPAIKKHMVYQNKTNGASGEMDFTYFNAKYTVLNALSKVKDEKGMKRVEKFLREDICPKCHGTRLNDRARAPKIKGMSLDEVCSMTLDDVILWVKDVPSSLPQEMHKMAESICQSFLEVARRLVDLGLGYLTLDRASSTLSTGERQRMQLARAVRNRTTGVLYVLDEPSIGLHPQNIKGLNDVMHDLISDGNSVLLVDHDTQILKESDCIIEMGPVAGAKGGHVLAKGSVLDIEKNDKSVIGPYLKGDYKTRRRPVISANSENKDKDAKVNEAHVSSTLEEAHSNLIAKLFEKGTIYLKTAPIHTVKSLDVQIPKGRLTVVTGVSGSGKTTLVLESLIPALTASINNTKLPEHIKEVKCEGISQIKLIDATPIGINVRSTVATYANVHDELRKLFAKSKEAKEKGYKAGDFSYNTGKLRCPVCDGTGEITLDVQFLPDVEIPCTKCHGSRYSNEAHEIHYKARDGKEYSLPELMDMDVTEAIEALKDVKLVSSRLKILESLGLGYLTLGEQTPSLSGGEAQRLKLASEIGHSQDDSVFVFDEPTIGLHPQDVATLLDVFQTLIESGGTVIVIEHDLDVIRNADYIIDMGPYGGIAGGRIVATGTVDDIKNSKESITGKFLN